MIDNDSYKKTIAAEFPKVLRENVLFWNMWNLTYAYDILEKNKDEYEDYFDILQEMWTFCWDAIAAKQLDTAQFEAVFGKSYPMEIDEDGEMINPKNTLQENYDDLSGDNLTELAISLLIGGFNTIYEGVTKGAASYGERARGVPIEVIALIIASNGYRTVAANMELPIVQNEVVAQTTLIKDLSQPNNYTIADKNIYRDADAMNSLQYIPEEEEE